MVPMSSATGGLPLITICMPTFRRTDFVREALASCLAQTADNYEVIVHDSSEDDSVKTIVESFNSPKVTYVRTIPGLGLLPKLNQFADRVHSEWMVFLCDDDVLEPGYIETVTKHLLARPDAALIRCRHRLVDVNGDLIRLDGGSPFLSTADEFMLQLFRPDAQSFRTNISAVTFKVSTLRAVGGIKELGKTWHSDKVAWAEMGSQGDVICDPHPLARLRLHAQAISGGLDSDYESAIAVTLAIRPIILQAIANLRARLNSPAQLRNLEVATREFGGYIERSLGRAIDQGLLAIVSEGRGNVRGDVRALKAIMEEFHLRRSRSVLIYEAASQLPSFLRRAVMSRFRRFKLAKLARR
jgi:hypothetical protein